MSAVLAIFGTLPRTYPITLKLSEYRRPHFEQKARKNWQYFWPFGQNCHLKNDEIDIFGRNEPLFSSKLSQTNFMSDKTDQKKVMAEKLKILIFFEKGEFEN